MRLYLCGNVAGNKCEGKVTYGVVMQLATYATSFVNVCSSELSHIVHGRIFLVPFITQTLTHIVYEAAQQGLQLS